MRIESLRRIPNRGGNPVYEVTFVDGMVARTAAGSQVSFGIENAEYAGRDIEVDWRRGEIVAISLAANR